MGRRASAVPSAVPRSLELDSRPAPLAAGSSPLRQATDGRLRPHAPCVEPMRVPDEEGPSRSDHARRERALHADWSLFGAVGS